MIASIELLAGVVHDVERRAEHLRDADGAVGGLAFHLRRTRQRMALGAGDAALHDLLLQVVHQLAVLGMHGRDRAQLLAAREALHQVLVGHHDGVLVRHEMLEAVDAAVLHQRAHVAIDLVAPPGHGDVEGIVLAGLLRPLAPLVIGGQQRGLRRRDHEIDDHGGAAGCGRRRAGEEILARHRAHERQLHVGMRVDAAWHHILAAGVDDAGARGRIEVGTDCFDHAIRAIDIGARAAFGRHDGAATNQQGHVLTSPWNFQAGPLGPGFPRLVQLVRFYRRAAVETRRNSGSPDAKKAGP